MVDAVVGYPSAGRAARDASAQYRQERRRPRVCRRRSGRIVPRVQLEAGATKFLVGTEQGVVMGVNTRNKKQNNGVTVYDTMSGKHHSPIYSIQRNPLHTKYFLSVGDWSARCGWRI